MIILFYHSAGSRFLLLFIFHAPIFLEIIVGGFFFQILNSAFIYFSFYHSYHKTNQFYEFTANSELALCHANDNVLIFYNFTGIYCFELDLLFHRRAALKSNFNCTRIGVLYLPFTTANSFLNYFICWNKITMQNKYWTIFSRPISDCITA